MDNKHGITKMITKNELPALLSEAKIHFPAFRLNVIIVGYTGSNMPELALWQNIVIRGKYAHLITINLPEMTSRLDCYEAILHELVHAWQYEKNHRETDHDENFLAWVVHFGKLGYNISCPDFTVEQLEQAFNTTRKVA